ncbi:hypothetical protein EBU94_04300 [bacterium]|nr:hypothetical protein [bacterium]
MVHIRRFESFSQEKIDKILDKINDKGYDSLTSNEREYLKNPDGNDLLDDVILIPRLIQRNEKISYLEQIGEKGFFISRTIKLNPVMGDEINIEILRNNNDERVYSFISNGNQEKWKSSIVKRNLMDYEDTFRSIIENQKSVFGKDYYNLMYFPLEQGIRLYTKDYYNIERPSIEEFKEALENRGSMEFDDESYDYDFLWDVCDRMKLEDKFRQQFVYEGNNKRPANVMIKTVIVDSSTLPKLEIVADKQGDLYTCSMKNYYIDMGKNVWN